jgi:hypothetical protein
MLEARRRQREKRNRKVEGREATTQLLRRMVHILLVLKVPMQSPFVLVKMVVEKWKHWEMVSFLERQ